MRVHSPTSIRKRITDGGLSIAPAAARLVVGRCPSSRILHSGKIFVVFRDSFPHFRHGVPLGYEPRAEDGGDFTHVAGIEPIETHTINI
jgi:hypothetical protein